MSLYSIEHFTGRKTNEKEKKSLYTKYQLDDIVVDDDGSCYNRPTEKQDMDSDVLHKICSMHVMSCYGVIAFRFATLYPLHSISGFYFPFICLFPTLLSYYFYFRYHFFLSFTVWSSSLSGCEKYENRFYVSHFASYTHCCVLKIFFFFWWCWYSQCLGRLSRWVNILQIKDQIAFILCLHKLRSEKKHWM